MSVKYVWTQEYYQKTITTTSGALFTLTIKDGVCKETFATATGLIGATFPLKNLGAMDPDLYMEAAANSYLWRCNQEDYDMAEAASKLGVECYDASPPSKTATMKKAAKDLGVPFITVDTNISNWVAWAEEVSLAKHPRIK